MNRRQFSIRIGALGALAACGVSAHAQGLPVEGKDYLRLATPIGMPPGKIEVVEFFGYWCPHCSAFESTLDAWARKLPADVSLRRVPVGFQPWHEPYQRLYYAIESLGLMDPLHRRAFAAVHVNRQRLEKDADIQKWATDSGQDGAKLLDAMKSFSTSSRLRQGAQLVNEYHIDSVPTLGIHGRFTTSPANAGTHERALQVTDQLVAQLRGGAKKG